MKKAIIFVGVIALAIGLFSVASPESDQISGPWEPYLAVEQNGPWEPYVGGGSEV